MKKMKFEETQHEKKSKKWKINENKKMIKKQNEKNEVTNENPNEKYMKNYLKHLQSVARCESYKICTSSGLLYLCSVLPL